MTPELSKQKHLYQTIFEAVAMAEAGKSPRWLVDLRAAGVAAFERIGFPTIRDEEWKYTNIAPVAKQAFTPGVAGHVEAVSKLIPFYPEAESSRLVFLNGRLNHELSAFPSLPSGCVVGLLADVCETHPEVVQKYFGQVATPDQNGFTALNTALMSDAVVIYIPRGKVVETPINLFFVSDHSADFQATFPRVLIVAEQASIATVVENYLALDDESGRFGDRPYLTNVVTEIVLEDGAILEHYKVQKESLNAYHIANTRVRIQQAAVLNGYSFALGGQISRNQIDVAFTAPGGECALQGLYYVSGKQLADVHLSVDHAHPNCTSQILYKGMLDDKARGVFDGKVWVRTDAQGTNANQTNKNLLLSTSARVDTKPQLEIFADDVKCSHGATVGQLNKDEIFYLLSRGLPLEQARTMLTFAFAQEVVDRIKIESIKSGLGRAISTRIAGRG